MKKMIFRLSLLCLAVAALLSGCSDASKVNELSVYICDSPAEFENLGFDLSRVEARVEGSEEWIRLESVSVRVPLLTLINGRMLCVARQKIDGNVDFDAVRLTFHPGNLTLVVGGEDKFMTLDPDYTTLTLPVQVRMDGYKTPLLIDLDAAASVTELPDGSYFFRPVGRVIDQQTCGAVQGGLQLGNSVLTKQIWIRFTDTEGNTFSTYSDLTLVKGVFFIRLAPGDYTMDILPPESLNAQPLSRPITVTSGKLIDLGVLTLEPVTQPE